MEDDNVDDYLQSSSPSSSVQTVSNFDNLCDICWSTERAKVVFVPCGPQDSIRHVLTNVLDLLTKNAVSVTRRFQSSCVTRCFLYTRVPPLLLLHVDAVTCHFLYLLLQCATIFGSRLLSESFH